MRTCCPDCATVFRITPDQLRARNGMVRCGQCRGVFNAFDSLIEDPVPLPAEAPAEPKHSSSPSSSSGSRISAAGPVPSTPTPIVPPEPFLEQPPPPEPFPLASDHVVEEPVLDSMPEPSSDDQPAEHAGETDRELEALERDYERVLGTEADEAPRPLDPIDAALQGEETPEQSARAAREAGLAAVRELSEAPGYDRWAAGTLHLDASGRILTGPQRRPLWPFLLAVAVLVLVLLAQLAYYFRTEIIQRAPGLRSAYQALNIGIPLPRQVDFVTIESSDLQADSARGLLVLQATLRNRAPYDQDWPALELTLTDTNDAVVARRVLQAADYLPPGANQRVFAATSEIGLKLWIESKQPAAGYRLYVFYP